MRLQETRVGKNNHRSASFFIRDAGFAHVFGDLLPGFIKSTDPTQTPCGGEAVLSPPCAIRPFSENDDVIGLFKWLAFAWVQVSPKHRALICSVYTATGASQDSKMHEENDALLSDISAVIAQFVLIFRPLLPATCKPICLPSVSQAIHGHGWEDPLNVVDTNGDFSRPLTFSRDSLFTGLGVACSSIDAVLLNHTASLCSTYL